MSSAFVPPDAVSPPGLGCTTCKAVILEKFRQGKLKANPPTQPVQATGLPHPSDLAVPIKKLWNNGTTFKVWFINGKNYPKHVALVKEVVQEWEKYAKVSFTFPSDWDEESPPEVRVYFSNNGYWSYIGRDVLEVIQGDNKPDNPKLTMNLRPDYLKEEGAEADFRGTILHEFGHTLGFIHEHQRLDANISYDLPKLYEYYESEFQWNITKVDEQVFLLEEDKGQDFAVNAFDTKSIMMYAVPAQVLKAGSTPIPRNNVLSDGDKEWAARIYPKEGERRSFESKEILRF